MATPKEGNPCLSATSQGLHDMSTEHVGHRDILSLTHLGTSCLKLSEVVERCQFDDLGSLNILHNTTVTQLSGRLTNISPSLNRNNPEIHSNPSCVPKFASISASGSPVEEKQTRMCCNPAIVKRRSVRSVTTQICYLRKVLAKFNTYHLILGNLGLENNSSVQGEMHHPHYEASTESHFIILIQQYKFS